MYADIYMETATGRDRETGGTEGERETESHSQDNT